MVCIYYFFYYFSWFPRIKLIHCGRLVKRGVTIIFRNYSKTYC